MELITELRLNGIEPFVTIYHWDLPQVLQDLGGWTNPLIIDWYLEYARVCYELFGNTVKYWTTFNEPKQICHRGYGSGEQAPAIKLPQAEFLCTHNLLRAHAKAWHLYQEEFKTVQKGILY